MKTKKLIFAALFAALTCVATMIIKVPTPTMGYIHPGDSIVLLSGFLLGPVYGGLAAGIGSMFSDLFGGYFSYAPATFVIKTLTAVFASLIFRAFTKKLSDVLKKDPKKIVFTEGTDPRILEASSRLLASNFLAPILIGKPQEIEAAAEESGFNIRGAEIIDPTNYDRMDEMIELFCELRKSKGVTPEQARGILSQANYFGTMLVKMGVADSLLGGATYSTADTVRPALQLIKTKPGNSIVSSCFIMVRPAATGENEVLAMADCAINIHPTEDELVEIAGETAECARIFGIDPQVAFLSYSTLGSGKGEDVDKMRNAAAKTKAKFPNLPIEGEIQFDAAVSPRVARTKCKDSEVAGHANTFIFPDINAGNIGYKIAQRLGNFEAYGPILLGLNAPVNDLSRGCNAAEVYSMAIITAALA